jgi:hypothetical protein
VLSFLSKHGKHKAVKRRDFIAALGGAAAMPLAARAQDRVRRVGVLMHSTSHEPEAQARIAALLQGLQSAGWEVGRNLRVDTRWTQRTSARMRPTWLRSAPM